MARELKPNEVITPKFRASFPDLFEAKSFQGKPAKFSIQMLFDKKADLTGIKKAMAAAVKEKYGDTPPKGLTSPLKSGDDKEIEGYEGMLIVSASTKFKPDVVYPNGEKIEAQNDFYAGCYARAFLSAYVYEVPSDNGKSILKKGIAFNLIHVQKLADGEPFVKRTNASDVFDSVDDGSSDKSNYESDDLDFLNT